MFFSRRERSEWSQEDYEDLGLEDLATCIYDGDERAEKEYRRRKAEEVRRLRKTHRFFVRFGAFGKRSQKGLDDEFLVTAEGGLYDEHMAEAGGRVVRYESGVSVYFAERVGGRAYVMREPDRRRAAYQLGYDYLGDMLRGPLLPAVCADEVWLVTGRLVLTEEEAGEEGYDGFESWGITWPTYEVGSDGEPLLKNVKKITRLDPWGDEPGVPKLLCCGYRNQSNLKPLMKAVGITRDDLDCLFEEEDEEDE